MSEDHNGHFDRLTNGLSAEQRTEFFRALHEAQIGADDSELARLLRALQLYKAFYEEIPARVREALNDADILTTRIDTLLDDIAERLDNAVAQLNQNTAAASEISNQFRNTQAHLTAAVEKSAAAIVQSLETVLRDLLSAALLKPFESCLDDIRDQCACTTSQARQIASELKLARRIHIGAYAVAAAIISVTLGLGGWFVAAQHYSDRETELFRGIDQNRQVLSELARKRAALEVRRNPADTQKLYLLVRRGKSWTTDKHVVVEVK